VAFEDAGVPRAVLVVGARRDQFEACPASRPATASAHRDRRAGRHGDRARALCLPCRRRGARTAVTAVLWRVRAAVYGQRWGRCSALPREPGSGRPSSRRRYRPATGASCAILPARWSASSTPRPSQRAPLTNQQRGLRVARAGVIAALAHLKDDNRQNYLTDRHDPRSSSRLVHHPGAKVDTRGRCWADTAEHWHEAERAYRARVP